MLVEDPALGPFERHFLVTRSDRMAQLDCPCDQVLTLLTATLAMCFAGVIPLQA